MTRKRHKGTFGGDGNVFYLDGHWGYIIQVDVFVKMHQMVHLTFRHFIVCKTGLNKRTKYCEQIPNASDIHCEVTQMTHIEKYLGGAS